MVSPLAATRNLFQNDPRPGTGSPTRGPDHDRSARAAAESDGGLDAAVDLDRFDLLGTQIVIYGQARGRPERDPVEHEIGPTATPHAEAPPSRQARNGRHLDPRDRAEK